MTQTRMLILLALFVLAVCVAQKSENSSQSSYSNENSTIATITTIANLTKKYMEHNEQEYKPFNWTRALVSTSISLALSILLTTVVTFIFRRRKIQNSGR
ncbi:hypothetical protein ACOME3_003348 [Neoechinorhynchus agilis]